MKENTTISTEKTNQAIANSSSQKTSIKSSTAFIDNRPDATTHKKLQGMITNSAQSQHSAQLQAMMSNSDRFGQSAQLQAILNNNTVQEPIQRKSAENNTGLPDNLKAGVENLSGIDISDVKVHYNSDKPAQLNAHAYAQGTDIHVASGQEKHLPHEAWHVVQQKQGRVKPTMQMKGNVNINDDVGLEKEADVMGSKALRSNKPSTSIGSSAITTFQMKEIAPIQRMTFAEALKLGMSGFAIRSAHAVDDLSGASFALVPPGFDLMAIAGTSTTDFYRRIKASCQMMVNLAAEDGSGYFLILKTGSKGIGGGYEGTLDKYNSANGSTVLLSIPIAGQTADTLFNTVIGNLPEIKNLTPDAPVVAEDLEDDELADEAPAEQVAFDLDGFMDSLDGLVAELDQQIEIAQIIERAIPLDENESNRKELTLDYRAYIVEETDEPLNEANANRKELGLPYAKKRQKGIYAISTRNDTAIRQGEAPL